MKILFRTTLLFSVILGMISCKSSGGQNYGDVYNRSSQTPSYGGDMEKIPVSASTYRSSNKDCCGTNETTFTADLRTIPKYKGEQPPVVPVQPMPVVEQRPSPVQPIEVVPPTPDYTGVQFRTGKLQVVDPRDADKLKRFNAVIVTLSIPANVEKLKRKLEADHQFFFIAKNEKGWFYFIVESSDDRDVAVRGRNDVVEKYTSKYTPRELQRRYGMPFTDAWIQINE